MTRTCAVLGTTCEHRARSMHEEISEDRGVSHGVVLAAGPLTVNSDSLSVEAVAAVVRDAGNELAG